MNDLYSNKRFFLEILSTLYEKEHFHRELELIYVLEGKITVIVEDRESRLDPHDILVINSEKVHTVKASAAALYMKLTFQYQMFSDIMDFWTLHFVCDSSKNRSDAYSALEQLLRQLLSQYLGNAGKSVNFLYISLYYQVMDCLCRHFLVRSSTSAQGQPAEKLNERILQISSFLHENYASPISLKELAERMHLSSGYLSRFFHRQYGMSFGSYLTKVRLNHALDMLLYTSSPITEIVYECGFANATMFNKAFREEYGKTPSELRKQSEKVTLRAEASLTRETARRLESILWLAPDEDMAAGSDAVLHIDCSAESFTDCTPLWNRVLNIGAASELLRSETREQVLTLKKELGITFLRFTNPFSKEMNINARQNRIYNFSRLDGILDFLTANEIRPFIMLSFSPRHMARNVRQVLLRGDDENLEELSQWLELLEAFLLHVCARYGKAALESWIFEVGERSDVILDDAWSAAFCRRFHESVKLIRRIAGKAKVGGCSLMSHCSSMDELAAKLSGFYRLLLKEDQPDYISYAVYCYDMGIRDGRIFTNGKSTDISFPRHCAEVMEILLKQVRPDHTELYITQWNLTVSHRNWLNDTCYKGAYLIRNYIDLMGKVEMAAYDSGSDLASEFYDSSSCLFGGMGLLSRDGIPKPVFHAMSFLNRLFPYQADKGENYLLTADGQGNYAMVCHNLRPLNHNYFMETEDQLDLEHFSRYYESLDPLSMDFHLRDVPDGKYRIWIRRVNEDAGSVLQLWRGLGYESELSPSDIQYLRNYSKPDLRVRTVETKAGTLHLNYTMQANEFALIQIYRIR